MPPSRVMFLGVAIFLATVISAFPVVAAAQTRLQDTERDRWALSPGKFEPAIQLGGGFSVSENTREATEFAFLPRLGYVFAEQGHVLPGSFEIVGEPTFLTVLQHQTVYVGGLAALLKYNVQTGTRWTPYLVGGGGVSFASHRLPHGGTNFNFILAGGGGVQYAITPRALIGAEWQYQHFSNANISPPNPSLNMSVFLLGFIFPY